MNIWICKFYIEIMDLKTFLLLGWGSWIAMTEFTVCCIPTTKERAASDERRSHVITSLASIINNPSSETSTDLTWNSSSNFPFAQSGFIHSFIYYQRSSGMFSGTLKGRIQPHPELTTTSHSRCYLCKELRFIHRHLLTFKIIQYLTPSCVRISQPYQFAYFGLDIGIRGTSGLEIREELYSRG